jgi:hypothetical protein
MRVNIPILINNYLIYLNKYQLAKIYLQYSLNIMFFTYERNIFLLNSVSKKETINLYKYKNRIRFINILS